MLCSWADMDEASLGLDDSNQNTTNGSYPSPHSMAQSFLLSPYVVVSPSLTTTSTRAQPTPLLDSNNTQKQRNTRRQDVTQIAGFDCPSGRSSPNPKKIQRILESQDRQESATSVGRVTGPEPPAAMMAAAAATSLSESNSRPQTGGGCRCLHLTACLLDQLCAQSTKNATTAMDVLLGYFRKALVHYSVILDCERCASLSENNMLLAMAGQYMSSMCEQIVTCYTELQQAQTQQQTQSQRPTSLPGDWASGGGVSPSGRNSVSTGTDAGLSADEMWFSTYRIESSCERMQVLRCLVTVQLMDFSRLLDKLKRRAGTRRGHLVPLTEAEKNVKMVRSMLRTRPSFSSDFLASRPR